MYQFNADGSITRLSDKLNIPVNEGNADYQDVLAWINEGNMVAPMPTPPLLEQRAVAVAAIDKDVDALIAAVTGNRASEYERAESQAIAFAAVGYVGPVPGCVASWAFAKGWTAQQATDDILATSAAWRTAQDAIRAQRLLRKERARTAVNGAAVEEALAEWAGFLAQIKIQLGV